MKKSRLPRLALCLMIVLALLACFGASASEEQVSIEFINPQGVATDTTLVNENGFRLKITAPRATAVRVRVNDDLNPEYGFANGGAPLEPDDHGVFILGWGFMEEGTYTLKAQACYDEIDNDKWGDEVYRSELSWSLESAPITVTAKKTARFRPAS